MVSEKLPLSEGGTSLEVMDLNTGATTGPKVVMTAPTIKLSKYQTFVKFNELE